MGQFSSASCSSNCIDDITVLPDKLKQYIVVLFLISKYLVWVEVSLRNLISD